MNKEALIGVAEWLEAGAPHVGDVIGFNMEVGVEFSNSGCGAVCCIAGAVCQFNQPFHLQTGELGEVCFPKYPKHSPEDSVMGRAQGILGISDYEADELFTPNRDFVNWNNVTPVRAAKVIRNYIKTGVIDWDVGN